MPSAYPQTWFTLTIVVLLGATAEAAVIRLKPAVRVVRPLVTLADVADVLDNDPRLVESLSSIVLAPSPPPGRRTQLDFDTIRSRLAARGADLSHLEFEGSSAVEVTSPGEAPAPRPAPTPAAPRPVVVAALSDVTRQLAVDKASKAVVTALATADQPAPWSPEFDLSDDQCRAILSTADRLAAAGLEPREGVQTCRLEFVDRGGQPHRLDVACRLHPWPQIVVFAVPVMAGRILSADDVRLQPSREEPAADQVLRPEDAIGREVVRAFREGDPVASRGLRTVQLVKRGEIVTIFSRQGRITIRTEGKARAAGGLGDTVQVTTLDGKEAFAARVVGLRTTEVGNRE